MNSMLSLLFWVVAIWNWLMFACCAYPTLSDQYVTIPEADGSTFQLRRVQVSGQLASCYEAKKASDHFGFCFPPVNIIGIPKCGTSAMYQFLVSHKGMRGAHADKEYCPKGNIFSYFRGFAQTYPYKRELLVNGCISPEKNYAINSLLRPKTANILMVRNFPDRLWATYNFWCSKSLDIGCLGGGWTKNGMYRTPEMFHELLLSGDSPQSNTYPFSCERIAHAYTATINSFATDGLKSPHVVSIEALSSPQKKSHLKRLQDFINTALGANISLQINLLHRVNAGDERGSTKISHSLEEGMYKISGHRPMLPESGARIRSCWRDCKNISEITHYNYDCA